jgi:hypothetical protein
VFEDFGQVSTPSSVQILLLPPNFILRIGYIVRSSA